MRKRNVRVEADPSTLKSSVAERAGAAKRRRNWKFGLESKDKGRKNAKKEEEEEKPVPVRNGGPSTSDYNFDDGSCNVNLKRMADVVVCSLCEGYLVDATTVIDCLHSFCKSCLLKYFDDDETTCPTCGILIHQSHPAQYVSFDRTMQDVIHKIVPGLMLDEQKNRQAYLHSQRKAAGRNVEEEEKKKAKIQEEERVRGTNRCYQGNPTISHHRCDDQVVVQLKSSENELPLPSRPVIRCSEMTTINTLKRYLALSLWEDISRYNELDIFYNGELMGKDFSLRFIWLTRKRNCPRHEPLDLHYAYHNEY
ncbi:unnamed protein product [Caenorhabditis auriculariae]|uniref:RING-type domain-containing protein n=1 Tax=Caenorhabditis auriculariae TaxID=2777116 RepID=A0A8S1HGS3_9PELO|nr:unnamed protein product [Caenorhabditis auriculariae]